MDILYPNSSDSNPTKTCIGPCGRELPATTEYFYAAPNTKGGLEGKCKKCRGIKLVIPDGHKICTGTCGRTLPATTDHFDVSKRGKYGLCSICKLCKHEYQKEYSDRTEVRERRREYAKKRYNSSPEVKRRKREYHKEYHSRPEVKKRRREYHKEYYKQPHVQAHTNKLRKERYSQPHMIQYVKERDRKYHARPDVQERMHKYYINPANRVRLRAYVRNRRALKRAAVGNHTASEIRQQYENQKGKCYYCNKKVGNKYDVDHVVPLSRGGSNDMSNLVIACPGCNRSKNNKLPHEWPEGGRLL